MMLDVEVTDQDIQSGQPSNSSECALAIAFRRALKRIGENRFDVTIGDRVILIAKDNRTRPQFRSLKLPKVAKVFRFRFDQKENRATQLPKPIRFQIGL